MKKIILLIVILLLLNSCSHGSYIDSVTAHDLYLKANYAGEDMYELDKDVIYEISDEELPYLLDFVVIRSRDAKNINEIGIFQVESGNSDELEQILNKYVKEKQTMYRAMNYLPMEAQKVDYARVEAFGNYVIYSFLSEEDTRKLYWNIENALNKESTAN